MRNQLRAIGAREWGTKGSDVASTCPRRGKTRDPETRRGTDCARELAEAGGRGELRVPRAPNEPFAEERARHEVTHLPYQPWCAWRVMVKGRAKPHVKRPVESAKVPEFEMDFCYFAQDPKRRLQPGDRAWATTLVMVDVAAKSPLCAAISTKSYENAYLAYVKRMAYAKAILKVDPEPALKLLADKIAVRASADGIQPKFETAPRFSSQSIGAVERAQDAVEGQIRCVRLDLETRLSIEVTPAMDVWPWLVRHAGWLRERCHVKGNKKTAFEDCCGKPYQGEVMKFAEAALFRVAVSPSGKIRDGIRHDRADARFVRGVWLGKTTESDEHLFANEMGVYTTRTGKRVPDTELKRADLVKDLQGTPRNRLAGRLAGRLRKTAPQATPVQRPPVAKETERPSAETYERRSAKAQELNPPVVPHVIQVLRAADTVNERSSSIAVQTHGDRRWVRSTQHNQQRPCAGQIASSSSEQTDAIDRSEWRTQREVSEPT